MNKSIDDLVPDIYGLFKNEAHECNPERVKAFGEALASKIAERLREVRLGKSTLRMSNLGKPDRQLFYDIKEGSHEGEVEELPAQAKIKFLFGDILELMLLFLAEEAGHEVTHKQEKVEVDGVFGSCDAVIDGVVVDCKSASPFAFKKFEYGTLAEDDAFGYYDQLAGYSTGLGGLPGAFLAIEKSLGKLALLKVPKEELEAINTRDRIRYLRDVLANEVLPERCYESVPEGKSGNMALGVGCSYCPHKFHCWSDANDGVGLRTFIYSSGPKYLTHVEQEPRVMEVTF